MKAESRIVGNPNNPDADTRYRGKRKLETRVKGHVLRMWDELSDLPYGSKEAASLRSEWRTNDDIARDVRRALQEGRADVEPFKAGPVARLITADGNRVAELRHHISPELEDELEHDPNVAWADVLVGPDWLRPARYSSRPSPGALAWYIAKRAHDRGRDPAEFRAKHGPRELTPDGALVVLELLDEWGASHAAAGRAFGGRSDNAIHRLEAQGRRLRHMFRAYV